MGQFHVIKHTYGRSFPEPNEVYGERGQLGHLGFSVCIAILHKKGIAHSDLNPENVLCKYENQLEQNILGLQIKVSYSFFVQKLQCRR